MYAPRDCLPEARTLPHLQLAGSMLNIMAIARRVQFKMNASKVVCWGWMHHYFFFLCRVSSLLCLFSSSGFGASSVHSYRQGNRESCALLFGLIRGFGRGLNCVVVNLFCSFEVTIEAY